MKDWSALTPAEWNDVIAGALRAQDVAGVSLLIRCMAIYHPEEAESTRQMLLLGASMAKRDAS